MFKRLYCRPHNIAIAFGILVGLSAVNASYADYELADALAPFASLEYEAALAKLEPLARRGDAVAQAKIGQIYAHGLSVPQDFAIAAAWLTHAAHGGQAEAAYEPGLLYLNGLGVARSSDEAARLFVNAAMRGHTEAATALGHLYIRARDYSAAHRWFVTAAELAGVEALLQLGSIYLRGSSVEADQVEALKWLTLAAGLSFGPLYDLAEELRIQLAEQLMPAQVQMANQKAEEWSTLHWQRQKRQHVADD